MRLHRLEVTAFGPFADHQRVDFDHLSQAGLFLLHGPTGAGKTSVLDAVCFALYGRVPGGRGGVAGVGRLRSDHAPAHVGPEVVLEFSVSGRRLEITRSPEWQRPKRRGTGTVREQAHVVLRELAGGGWNPLTNRIDEASDLLQQLIGLGAEQFTKLILLPQGEFAAFLRATPEERRPLLQKLFGTDRFAEVERWLAERRRESEHQVQAAATTTARLFARAEEARLPPVAEPSPSGGSGHSDTSSGPSASATVASATVASSAAASSPAAASPAASSATDGPSGAPPTAPTTPTIEGPPEAPPGADEAATRVAEWAAEAGRRRSAAHREARRFEQLYENARQEAQEAGAELDRCRRLNTLTAELDRLLADGLRRSRHRAEVAAAGRAQAIAPLLLDLDRARGRLEKAAQREVSARTRVQETGGHELVDDLEQVPPARLAELGAQLVSLAELVRAETDRAELEREGTALRERLAEAEREQAGAGAEETALAAAHEQRTGERTAAEALARTRPDRELDLTRARAVAAAVLEAGRVTTALAAAEADHRSAVDTHQKAVDVVQDLRERRLRGMAAELAAGLNGDSPCPVCGSAEHPAPARHRATPVTEAAQRRAETAAATAEAARERARAAVQAGQERRAALLAVSGGVDAAAAAVTLEEAETRLARTVTAARQVERLSAELATIAARRGRAAERRDTGAVRAGEVREQLAAVTARRTELERRLDQARGDDADVRTRHHRLAAALEALTEYQGAARARADAQSRQDEAAAAADRAATAAGFTDRAAAARAVRPETEVRRLAEAVEAYDAEVARLRALLDDAGGTGGRAELTLDLDLGDGPGTEAGLAVRVEELRVEVARCREAHEIARRQHVLADRAVQALTALSAELRRHAATTAPLRARFASLESVSRCVEGTGGDNALKMRLSSYVLAARLEQVAEAASARLGAMSGGRYLLVHTDGPSRGGARSGLGLAVVDGWTGIQRDPASLSGGESFCTSLALALGLADVVQAESGGSVIETLLVDEGFGSLDEETLDEVMDVLDGLRSAGRAVGLVSHVSDLRDRIPVQLEVIKGRAGSRLVA
jgi:DNA repair protein SbcC/Rad50